MAEKNNQEDIKLPPQNIEAEQSVLGSLMLDKDSIVQVADILKPNDFYRTTHKNIYQAMLDLYDKSEPIDVLSLSNKLEEKDHLEKVGGASYLTSLVNLVPTASHASYYAKIIRNKKTLRDLIETSQRISEWCYKESEDVEKLVDKAEQGIFNISQTSFQRNFIALKDGLSEAFERIESLHRGDGLIRGVPSGFLDLDNYLSGFQKSDLIILAARPSVGKTTLALDFARNIANKQKLPVALFSIEMSREQLVDKLISAQAGVDLWKMRGGYLSTEGPDNDFEKIQTGLNELSETPIFIDDTPSPTTMQIRTVARRLHAEHNLGLVIIDYLQMIQPRNGNDSPVQQMTEISRGLKALARELNVPVLALSQLNRAVESRSPAIPKLSDLRDSGCLIGSSKIICANTGKMLSIRKLAQRKKQTPVKVLAIDKNYQIKPHRLIKAFSSGKKTVYKLKTTSGRIIKASANHPFLKIDGWTRLDKLKQGDSLALPRQIKTRQPSKSPLSKNELVLLAHLLGDGCILPKHPFHYTNAYKENIQAVKKSAKKLFGINGKIVKQKNWYHLYLTSPYKLARGKHHPITNWHQSLNLKLVRSWKKRVPAKLFRCRKEDIALFLKHIWATDGNLSWKKIKSRKPAGAIYYSTSSKILGHQIQHLLLRLGINSSLRSVNSKKGYRLIYQIWVQGSENQLKFLKLIGIADRRKKIIPKMVKELRNINPNPNNDIIPKDAWKNIIEPAKDFIGLSWRSFAQAMQVSYNGTTLLRNGIGRGRMKKIAGILKSEEVSNLANSDLYWDKIVSIKKLGVREVYDATVENAHNFIANDIVVHNSIEQDADVVMFIYREDKDKRETDRENIADLIIAKHRNGPIGQLELFFNEKHVSFKNLEKRYE